MGAFSSQYTGNELDLAISKVLGDTYRGEGAPGCHLVGDKSETPMNLNDLAIPGKYTVYFFYNGPADAEGDQFSVSPIFVHVYWSGQMLYQTIRLGPKLYWRDLISGDLTWKMIDMGVEATRVVDNLYTDKDVDEAAGEVALSANMGAELRKMIERRQIGNINLLDCTDVLQGYSNSDNMTKIANYWTIESNCEIVREAGSVISDISTIESGDETAENPWEMQFFKVKNPNGGSFTSFGSYIKGTQMIGKYQSFTASVVLKEFKFTNSDINVTDNEHAKVFIKIVCQRGVGSPSSVTETVETMEYSLKDFIKSFGEDVAFNGGIGKLRVTLNARKYGTTTNTDIRSDNLSDYQNGPFCIRVSFGITDPDGTVEYASFYHPKLELGDYATEYNHSANDLRYWYTNTEKIFDADINATSGDDFDEQDGLVYSATTKEFNHEAVAVGGGGGFNKYDSLSDAANNSRIDKILVLIPGDNTSTNPKRLVFWNGTEWISATNPALVEADQDTMVYRPINDMVMHDCGWLNQADETDSTPAVLNYYDTQRSKWRPVGAMPQKIWHISEEAPTDPALRTLFWIKESTMAPHIYVNGGWRPLLTVWGATT